MNVLCVATHPDDETLGAGGTLLTLAAKGERLHWLAVTAAHEALFSPHQIKQQADQVHAVQAAYPFETFSWLKFPATRLDTVPVNELVVAIRQVVERVRPEWVFVPNRSDVHSDHRVTFHATMAVLKSFYMRTLGVKRILACEVLSETKAAPSIPESVFAPNVFVDVSTMLGRKLEIMKLYQSEIQPNPLPRSPSAIQALARYRGATVGLDSAEAFMLIRDLLP